MATGRDFSATRLKCVLRRSLLLVAGLIYLAVWISSVRGEWALSHAALGNLGQAARSHPRNPELWTQYGIFLLNDLGNSNLNSAALAYLHAIALNPLAPVNWDGLASAYIRIGDATKAESALRGWLVAVPHSPDAAWRLGIFLVLQNRVPEAFPYLKVAAERSPKLRTPAFDLFWKIVADPHFISKELIPADPSIREEYMYFLLQTKRVDNAGEIWAELKDRLDPDDLELGYNYVESLRDSGMAEQAARVWADLLERSGRGGAKPPGELVTNGDFEEGLPNRGLDWIIGKGPGFQIELDDATAQSGRHSLKVSFDGTSNVNFSHVLQEVPVEPNRDYRFRGYLRTENITSDSGLHFLLVLKNSQPPRDETLSTTFRLGTNPWTLETVDFHTGPATHFVFVLLIRPTSDKLNNLIQGHAWIDNISIKRLP